MRVLLLAASVLLAGCVSLLPSADRVDIQQGNLLDDADISAIEPGMSRAEVRQRLGGPVLNEGFNPQRWDYLFYRTEAGRETGDIERLSVYFEQDRVVRVSNRYNPPEQIMPDELPDIPDEDERRPPPERGPRAPSPGPGPGPSR